MGDNSNTDEVQHQIKVSGEPYKESAASKVVFLAGVTLVSLFAGVGLKLGLAGRRYRRSLKNKPGEEGHEDPVLLACRALGWGTTYALGGTGVLVLVSTGIWKLVNRCTIYRCSSKLFWESSSRVKLIIIGGGSLAYAHTS